MYNVALMIIDSGRVLNEYPMIHNIEKENTPKGYIYIGSRRAIRESDVNEFVATIKIAHSHIDEALKEITDLRFRFYPVASYTEYKNKARTYAEEFQEYLNMVLFEFGELEIVKAVHPLLNYNSESFLNKYWDKQV
jgi:hypothetical protein